MLSYSRGGLVGELLADRPPPLDEQISKALAARTAGRGREWEQVATLLQGEPCMGRRMAEGAALLVDHVLPAVGYRQWVLSKISS